MNYPESDPIPVSTRNLPADVITHRGIVVHLSGQELFEILDRHLTELYQMREHLAASPTAFFEYHQNKLHTQPVSHLQLSRKMEAAMRRVTARYKMLAFVVKHLEKSHAYVLNMEEVAQIAGAQPSLADLIDPQASHYWDRFGAAMPELAL
jgi:hypothetical protein